MKTQLIRQHHKVLAALMAIVGTALCLGSTVVAYEQVAAQAVMQQPTAVASAEAHRS